MIDKTYFQLDGEFLGVCAIDGYKLNYLRLRTVDSPQERLRQRDILVKVPKKLRAGLVYQLAIGDRIRCEGIQKDLKFKASAIKKVVRVASPAENRAVSPAENEFTALPAAMRYSLSPESCSASGLRIKKCI